MDFSYPSESGFGRVGNRAKRTRQSRGDFLRRSLADSRGRWRLQHGTGEPQGRTRGKSWYPT